MRLDQIEISLQTQIRLFFIQVRQLTHRALALLLALAVPLTVHAGANDCAEALNPRLFNRNFFVDERYRKLESMTAWPKGIRLFIRHQYIEPSLTNIVRRKDHNQELVVQVDPSLDVNAAARALAEFYNISEIEVYNKLKTASHSEVSISDLLPPFFKKAGDHSLCLANCWNAAFRFHQRAILPVYMTDVGAVLRLQYFSKPVDLDNDKLRFGDLVAVWRSENIFGREVPIGSSGSFQHLAIYVGGHIVFHKEGPYGPYSYQEFGPYGVQETDRHGYSGTLSAHRLK